MSLLQLCHGWCARGPELIAPPAVHMEDKGPSQVRGPWTECGEEIAPQTYSQLRGEHDVGVTPRGGLVQCLVNGGAPHETLENGRQGRLALEQLVAQNRDTTLAGRPASAVAPLLVWQFIGQEVRIVKAGCMSSLTRARGRAHA